MITKVLLIFIFSSTVLAQEIADIAPGSHFKFDLSAILKKQKECLKTGDDYRATNKVHFVNGELECNSPLFQRSCEVELSVDKTYSSTEVCSLQSTKSDPHAIELNFQTMNCPLLKCRPLMWTGLFTGPDIGVKSLKYNLGKYIIFSIEEGINQDQKSSLDKRDNMNKVQNSSQSSQAVEE